MVLIACFATLLQRVDKPTVEPTGTLTRWWRYCAYACIFSTWTTVYIQCIRVIFNCFFRYTWSVLGYSHNRFLYCALGFLYNYSRFLYCSIGFLYSYSASLASYSGFLCCYIGFLYSYSIVPLDSCTATLLSGPAAVDSSAVPLDSLTATMVAFQP